MQEKNKLIGRGLKDLIEEHNIDKVLDGEAIIEIKLSSIVANPNQPRKVFDPKKISELASSIKEYGVFQPIILKKVESGYIIVSGERRYRASIEAGLLKIPAVIRNYSNERVAEISLIENLQREDLSPIEEALAYESIIKQLKITQNDLANKIGKSRSYITNMLGILRLPEVVKEMLLDKKLSMSHARTLSKLKDEKEIISLANKIVNENINVREVEDLASNMSKSGNEKKEKRVNKYKDEKKILEKYYQAKVSIKDKRIIINISNEEELNRVVKELIKNAI